MTQPPDLREIDPLPWLDPLELVRITGDYGAVGDAPSSRGRSAALRAEPATLSQAKPAATIAGALADWQGLFWTALAFLIVIFAYGELA